MKRVIVVGTSGSGKTTVAGQIAVTLGIHHIELDSIHWQPNWTELPDEEFIDKVKKEIDRESWVADGNYKPVRDLLWRNADTLVWLDLPFRVVFWRVLRRTIKRVWTRERLWNDNIERLSALFGNYAMPLWVIKTYRRRKREYSELTAHPEYNHLQVHQLKTVKEVKKWLRDLVRN